eukprot:CAMPEP_0206143694 /NCGR_PEP_ID=MMETSP1473-20131121/21481_1 /ASSEMBLY_ACC=CAM_ASM_001109 /TAXON_ID=1461547 /ORGANISM="Stichococcus sp, Strain RCC1054" /LENGTH=72 /DNA_ID=CAMNT_0053539209 /DNA_START=251 /DNA_END=469 /DNA_ORIENTATION=+
MYDAKWVSDQVCDAAAILSMKSLLMSQQNSSSQGAATAMPASRSVCMPAPPTSGLGSCTPTTTRATLAATSA